jgi:GntR family transcriptional regulator
MDDAGGAATNNLATREEFVVSRASPIPLYVQIRNILLAQIRDGRLEPGARIPRERELGERFGVSLAPVRQALVDLAREGYLKRVQGRGTFVRRTKVEHKIAILSSFTESLRAEGVEGTVRVLRQEAIAAPAHIRSALRIRQNRVLFIERLTSLDEEPLALLRAYLPLSVVRDLVNTPIGGQSLYVILAESYGIDLTRAESIVEVIRCDPAESELLGITAGSQALLVESVTFDSEDYPVEFSRVIYRADRFRFALESHRRTGRVVHVMIHPTDSPTDSGVKGHNGRNFKSFYARTRDLPEEGDWPGQGGVPVRRLRHEHAGHERRGRRRFLVPAGPC